MILPTVFYALAAITILAAVAVLAAARFEKPVACLMALVGGLIPWLVIGMFHRVLPSVAFGYMGLGSAPLFMASFLHFGIGRKPSGWRTVAIASIVGACAGIGFSVFFYRWMLFGR